MIGGLVVAGGDGSKQYDSGSLLCWSRCSKCVRHRQLPVHAESLWDVQSELRYTDTHREAFVDCGGYLAFLNFQRNFKKADVCWQLGDFPL